MQQRVLSWSDEPLELVTLGEKPYKLMRLKQAKFPVPDFFSVVTDGSGRIHIDDSVRTAYDRLAKPLIGRSAHPMEGNGFSFSGRFESIERIMRLIDSPEDMVNYKSPLDRKSEYPEGVDIFELEYQWHDTRTFSLERAYSDIVGFANPEGESFASHRVKEYLEKNGITGFNPNDMNLLLMEQRAIDVFGMFLTSDQARPDEMVIHFQDRRTDKGDWVVYEKRSQRLRNCPEGDLENILVNFGKLAERVEQHFGKNQQVEIGYSDRGIEVYQARDVNLGDVTSVPRFAHYKTLSNDLHADGFGYFHLPVLVIDALDHVHSKHFDTAEEAIAEAVRPYKEQMRRFVEENPDYIAIVKDGDVFTGFYSENPDRFEDKSRRYAGLNEITGRAKVVFRGKCQNAIRHEDWDFIESGGINIWMSESEQMANLFIHNQIVGETAEWKARSYASSRMDDKYVPHNVTVVHSRQPIRTGDYVHVLANTDGTFVWRD